jgi:cytochrome P450
MRDRRLRRGMSSTLAKWGVETGPFAQWMRGQLLDLEGEPHHRLRGLVSGAFGQRRIAALEPLMRAKTHELVDRLTADAPAGVGRCEFMAAVFADPHDGPVTSRPSIGITGPITLPLRFTPVSAHRT